MPKFEYIRGYRISNARLLLKYLFPDEYITVDKNELECTFDVTLSKPERQKDLESCKREIEEFHRYWGKQYVFYWK